MWRIGRLSGLVFAPLALALTSCIDLGTRAYVGFLSGEVTGDTALAPSSGGPPNTRSDLESDFGIDDDDPSIWGRAEVATDDYGRIAVSAFHYSNEGSNTLSEDFGDINAGEGVDTELTFTNFKASWTYDLVDVGILRVSPGAAFSIYDVDTEATAQAPVIAFENVETFAPVPLLFAQASVDLSVAALDVEAGWMDIDLDDADGRYVDLEGMFRVNIAPKVELIAGYRYIAITSDGDADGQPFRADIQFDGWFVGGGVVF